MGTQQSQGRHQNHFGKNSQEKEVEGMSNVMNTKLTMECTDDENGKIHFHRDSSQ